MQENKENIELENKDKITPTEEELENCYDFASGCDYCKYKNNCKCQCNRPKGLFKRIAYSVSRTKWYQRAKMKKYDEKQIAATMQKLDREFKLACAGEEHDPYATACLKNAIDCYKAMYKTLYDEGHSGFSYGITINLIKRLLDEKPLTAITDEDFEEASTQVRDGEFHHCARYSSLFKNVYQDGKVVYNDLNRCVNIDEVTGFSYGNCFAEQELMKLGLIPQITMPYNVLNHAYRIYTLDVYYPEIFDELQDTSYRYIDYFITPQIDKVKVDKLYKIQHVNEFDDDYIEVVDKEEKKKVVSLLKSQVKRYKKEHTEEETN